MYVIVITKGCNVKKIAFSSKSDADAKFLHLKRDFIHENEDFNLSEEVTIQMFSDSNCETLMTKFRIRPKERPVNLDRRDLINIKYGLGCFIYGIKNCRETGVLDGVEIAIKASLEETLNKVERMLDNGEVLL